MSDALRGLRILLGRPEGQEQRLADLLSMQGAHVVAVPAVEIVPADMRAVDAPLARAAGWGVFTSTNGVRLVSQRPAWPGAFERIAAVGPATAKALTERGASVSWMPPAYTTASLATGLPGPACEVVLFRAAAADTDLEDTLTARGFAPVRVDVYDTRPVNADAIRHEIERGVDTIVLTSASIARAVAAATGGDTSDAMVCSIGPATSAACAAAGLRVGIEAAEHSVDGIVDALVRGFAGRS